MGTNYYLRERSSFAHEKTNLVDSTNNQPWLSGFVERLHKAKSAVDLRRLSVDLEDAAQAVREAADRIESIDRHIGKSTNGWVFSLHIYPEEGIKTFTDWLLLLKDPAKVIVDDRGREVSVEEMVRVITERQGDQETRSVLFDYSRNRAEPGPHNLVRRRIDYMLCVGHGEGTYDYLVGDFS